jgi:hypothetical protein
MNDCVHSLMGKNVCGLFHGECINPTIQSKGCYFPEKDRDALLDNKEQS